MNDVSAINKGFQEHKEEKKATSKKNLKKK